MFDLTRGIMPPRLTIDEGATYGHRIRSNGAADLYRYDRRADLTIVRFSSEAALTELLWGLNSIVRAQHEGVRV